VQTTTLTKAREFHRAKIWQVPAKAGKSQAGSQSLGYGRDCVQYHTPDNQTGKPQTEAAEVMLTLRQTGTWPVFGDVTALIARYPAPSFPAQPVAECSQRQYPARWHIPHAQWYNSTGKAHGDPIKSAGRRH